MNNLVLEKNYQIKNNRYRYHHSRIDFFISFDMN